MTTSTIAAGRVGAASHRPAPGAGFVTTTLASAQRTVLQFFRTPQVLVMGTIQGALFLFMFRYVFGGAIGTSRWLVRGSPPP